MTWGNNAILAVLRSGEGPDRELDEALFERQHGRKRRISSFKQYEPDEELPCYTVDIMAALTFLPEGYLWSVGCVTNGSGYVATLSHRSKSERGTNPAWALLLAIFEAINDEAKEDEA